MGEKFVIKIKFIIAHLHVTSYRIFTNIIFDLDALLMAGVKMVNADNKMTMNTIPS